MNLLGPKNARRVGRWAARLAPHYLAGKLHDPFFIIGCARSGTTLLVDALRLHPDVAAYPGEANHLWHPQTYPWRTSAHADDLPPLWADPETFTARSLALRSEDHARRVRAHFGAYQLLNGGDRFLNKSAMIAFLIPYIREAFPDSRFIHIVRDGRAVARSYLKKQKRKIDERPAVYERNGLARPFENLLDVFAATWKQHLEEIERQKADGLAAAGRYFELTYEDLCADPPAQLRQVMRFMGLAPERLDMARLPAVESTNYKYREELDADLIEKISATMEPMLSEKGYDQKQRQ